MIRKILLSLLLLILLAFGGVFTLLATNSDIIIDRFHSFIESTTGAPLISQTRPVFTLLPNRGLELGASSWQKPDGSLSISFSRASVLISSHDLFVGRFSIKNFTVDDLRLTMRLNRPLREHGLDIVSRLGERRDIDEIVRLVLRTLNISPDTINVRRGSICLIEPSGNSILLSPFTLHVSDVHPGSETDFSLKTELSGSAPAFRAKLDLTLSALFSKDGSSFVIKNARLLPLEGFSFTEALRLSGSLSYDYDSSSFDFSALEFSGPALELKASGGIASLAEFYRDPRNGGLSASIDMKAAPQKLGRLLGFTQPFEAVDMKADLHWNGGKLALRSMSGKADALSFTGGLQASFRPFTVSGDMHFTELHIDAFKGRTSADDIDESNGNDFSRWPRVALSVKAGKLLWDRLVLQDADMRISGQNGTYEINPLTASLAGSPVTASLKAVMLPTSPLSARIGLNFSVPEADLEDICQLLLRQNLLKGKGSINAALTFTSSRGLPSLGGTGSITSTSVETSFSVLPARVPVTSILSPGNRFDKFLIYFTAKEGLIDMQSFKLEDPRFALNGKGKLDLPKKRVDASGSMRLGGSTVLPVRLFGDIRDPKYSLDMRSNADKPASLDLTLEGDFAKKLDDILGAPR